MKIDVPAKFGRLLWHNERTRSLTLFPKTIFKGILHFCARRSEYEQLLIQRYGFLLQILYFSRKKYSKIA
jgi:hypothetical protein